MKKSQERNQDYLRERLDARGSHLTRQRVAANYLQLPINKPKKHVATNQRDGQMTYYVDAVVNSSFQRFNFNL
jgi:catalase